VIWIGDVELTGRVVKDPYKAGRCIRSEKKRNASNASIRGGGINGRMGSMEGDE